MIEDKILNETLEFNFSNAIDGLNNHIRQLRLVAISLSNIVKEKDKEITKLKRELTNANLDLDMNIKEKHALEQKVDNIKQYIKKNVHNVSQIIDLENDLDYNCALLGLENIL